MKTMEFYSKINQITMVDPRYSSESYEFINDAVVYTVKKFEKNRKEGDSNHVSGQQLLDGVREYALKQFGPMAYNVFYEWGITDGMAVGNIVFNMIEYQLLSRSENDSISDFENAFDFKTALSVPFIPGIDASDVELPIIA